MYNHAVSFHILHQELDVKFVLSRALEKAYHVWRCGPLNNWKETSAVLCKVAMVHGSKEYFMATTDGYREKGEKSPNFTCTPCINNVASLSRQCSNLFLNMLHRQFFFSMVFQNFCVFKDMVTTALISTENTHLFILGCWLIFFDTIECKQRI